VSLSWEDKLEIQELVARYDRAVDTDDHETWVDCFTEDGSWDGGPKIVGRVALLEFVRSLPTDPTFAAFRGARHFVTNFLVEETGPGEARLRCDNLMLQPREGGVAGLAAADYDDRLRRVDGRWLFVSRRWRPAR
jgi:uncharacterized protein (TIGR02246 family)